MWKLFIDDERFPVDVDHVIARSMQDAISLIETNGCPVHICFDHDLGDGANGYDFAKWLVNEDIEMDQEFFPKGFKFTVHSQNPIGKLNIESLLNSYLKEFPR